MIMIERIVQPAVEPVTRDDAKLHCRIDIDDDDTLIDGLIVAARELVEAESRRALITQTWRMVLHTWPADGLRLPLPPMQSVSAIAYIDEDGNTGTVSDSIYDVDTTSGEVWLAYNQDWPGVVLRPRRGVRIDFVAGYGDAIADVPEWAKIAIKLTVGHWYENREAVVVGQTARELPMGVQRLCWQNRGY